MAEANAVLAGSANGSRASAVTLRSSSSTCSLCGDGALGHVLLDAGCRSYLGIDGSERMVRVALENLDGTVGEALRRG
jgi:hypothetical protein